MDYLYFFNANMIFKSNVSEEDILPIKSKNGLISVIHPYFYRYDRIAPFEDNKDSVAYVDADKTMPYFQGCLSGGAASSYLKMAEEIKKMVDADLEKKLMENGGKNLI